MPERDPKEQRDPKEIDLEKVRDAQAGDREAFDYLVERHKDIVYARVSRPGSIGSR
jgi:hypothetical protein